MCYPLDVATLYKLNDHLISDNISKFGIKREPWIIRRKKLRDYILEARRKTEQVHDEDSGTVEHNPKR